MTADDQLLFIGSTCHLDSCRLNDFLPITCRYCSQTFCSSHFLPAAHTCDKWDKSAHDRIAPDCPLCGVPVAYPLGGDPNTAMENHFRTSCAVMGARVPSTTGSTKCAGRKCNKVLVSPIHCQACGQQYCPEHRFPASHQCLSLENSRAPTASSTKLLRPSKTSKSSGPSLVSLKSRSLVNEAKPAVTESGKTGAVQGPKLSVISKPDRRARAEQRSAELAIRERARKGLLSETEKIQFAEMEAARARSKNKEGCVVS